MSETITEAECPSGRFVGELSREAQLHASTVRTVIIDDDEAWDALKALINPEPLKLAELIGHEHYKLVLSKRGWRHG